MLFSLGNMERGVLFSLFRMGVPNSLGCQIPCDTGSSIVQFLFALVSCQNASKETPFFVRSISEVHVCTRDLNLSLLKRVRP